MRIKSLTMSNYMCFGENVKLELPEEGSILLIGNNLDSNGMSSNESGKTSLASAPFWALFGVHYSEDASADDVIREGTNQCEVQLELCEGEDSIKITRNRGSKNSLEFYVNDHLMNENVTVPSKVQEDVNKYFGITGTPKQVIDDFMSTNLLSYNSVEMFVSKRYKAEDRFAFLSRIFNLEKWIDCKKLAKEKRDELNPAIERLEGQLHVHQEATNSIAIETVTEESKLLTTENTNLLKELDDVNKQIEEAYEYTSIQKELTRYTNDYNSWNSRYDRNKNTLEKELTEAEFKFGTQKNIMASKQARVIDVEDYDAEKLNYFEKEKSKYESDIRTLNYDINHNKIAIKDKERLKESGFKCSECGADQIVDGNKLVKFNTAIIVKQIAELQSKIDVAEKSKTKSNMAIIALDADIAIEKNNLNKYNASVRLQAEIEHDKSMLKMYKEAIDKLKDKISQSKIEYDDECIKFETTIDDFTIKLQGFDTSIDINLLMEKTNELQDTIDSNKRTITINENNIGRYNAAHEKAEKCVKELKSVKSERDVYNYWLKAFPEIRRMIIQSVLPQIQNISNDYLNKIDAPFQIELDTLKETKTTNTLKESFNINVYDKVTDTVMPIHMRSTGGRKRVGMAVCFALQDIKSSYQHKSFEFRFFDEFLDNIDETGLDLFVNLLNNIEGQKFVISHNSRLADRFDKVVTIVKQNGMSTIHNN